MGRATIDYGIYLGAEYSQIAVFDRTEITVFENNEGFKYTPSAVWIDKNNRVHVGRRAQERLDDDPDNAKCEFLPQMGKTQEYRFARSGRVMKPEELSAEVLKSLKGDVKQRTGEDVQAAVITVPAAFDIPQSGATKRAAELAGFVASPLLQEPVAAALAYGFNSENDDAFWLIYDLRGGTFDAAIINIRDGVIRVVNHEGDTQLGGKLIDWAIVDQLLVPAVIREYRLTDFGRGNPKWVGAIAKLKLTVEEAKIRVSRDESAEISVEFPSQGDRGETVHFEYELKKRDVEQLAEPFILRSINICKKALEEKHLQAGDIEKVLLVGEPTLMPYLRERLLDRTHGLGIPLEYSKDPLNVVAQGAAIFARTQPLRLPTTQERRDHGKEGFYTVSFPEWKFSGGDAEPYAVGNVIAPAGQNLIGVTIEFFNPDEHLQWRSGKIALASNGAFGTILRSIRGRTNTFTIELCDGNGKTLRSVTDPAALTFDVGSEISPVPLTHSVGLALENNEVEWLFEKGTPLPARKRIVFRTFEEILPRQTGYLIQLPVVEGEYRRADRNRIVGTIEVKAVQLKRDVPVGTEVEITIEIDTSRQVLAKAYIPILDEEYEKVMKVSGGAPRDQEWLRKETEREKKRLADAQRRARETQDSKAHQALDRIDQERIVSDVDASLNAAGVDPDAADKCDKRLLDLKVAIDEVADALELPVMVSEAERLLSVTRDTINERGNTEEKQLFHKHEAELRKAIDSQEADLLSQRVEELRNLLIRVLDRIGYLQIIRFGELRKRKGEMRDQARAEQLISQGIRAENANDTAGLRGINRDLAGLLPNPPPPSDISSLTR